MQQILDREEAGVLEISGTTRPDALQELQGRGERIVCHGIAAADKLPTWRGSAEKFGQAIERVI